MKNLVLGLVVLSFLTGCSAVKAKWFNRTSQDQKEQEIEITIPPLPAPPEFPTEMPCENTADLQS